MTKERLCNKKWTIELAFIIQINPSVKHLDVFCWKPAEAKKVKWSLLWGLSMLVPWRLSLGWVELGWVSIAWCWRTCLIGRRVQRRRRRWGTPAPVPRQPGCCATPGGCRAACSSRRDEAGPSSTQNKYMSSTKTSIFTIKLLDLFNKLGIVLLNSQGSIHFFGKCGQH